VNEVICHGIPDQRKLVEGDIVNLGRGLVAFENRTGGLTPRSLTLHASDLDISLYFQGERSAHRAVGMMLTPSFFAAGFHGDVNATYAVGAISEESQNLIDTTRRCLDEAIKMCKPGALFRDIGKTM